MVRAIGTCACLPSSPDGLFSCILHSVPAANTSLFGAGRGEITVSWQTKSTTFVVGLPRKNTSKMPLCPSSGHRLTFSALYTAVFFAEAGVP